MLHSRWPSNANPPGPYHCWVAAAFALCFAVGCSHSSTGNKQAAVASGLTVANADAAATPQFLGKVHVIGTDGRFVLVQSPAASMMTGLVDGQALTCRAAGNVTASLRVSHERRPPFVVADVATGTPGLGDEVYIEPAGSRNPPAPAATPSPTPEFRANPPLPSAR